jgi:hypothetical protein
MSGSASPFPDFEIIRQEIDTQYFIQNNWKPDTLTEVVRQLTDFKIFATNDNAEIWNSLTDRTVIIDLHGLTVLREMTAFLVLNAVYRELMAMPDSGVADGVREMRTIIVIDEAHHFLKDKKRSVILERLIREIRSKGASIFLMSQSPDDYDQGDFDFTELLEFIFLAAIKRGRDALSAKCVRRLARKRKRFRRKFQICRLPKQSVNPTDGKNKTAHLRCAAVLARNGTVGFQRSTAHSTYFKLTSLNMPFEFGCFAISRTFLKS